MPTSTAALRAAFDADQFRNVGHKLIDRLAGYLSASTGGANMPVLPKVTPSELLAAWPANFVPGSGGRFDELVARLVAGSNHLHHPHFVGHQVSPVLPIAAAFDEGIDKFKKTIREMVEEAGGETPTRKVSKPRKSARSSR